MLTSPQLRAFVSNYDAQYNSRKFTEIVQEVCCAINTPFSMKVYYLIEEDLVNIHTEKPFYSINRRFSLPRKILDQATNINFNNNYYAQLLNWHHTSCSDIIGDNIVVGLIKKQLYSGSSEDRLRNAEKTFIQCETHCRKINTQYAVPLDLLHRVQDQFSIIIDDLPPIEQMQYDFGPGANFNVSGHTSVYDKMVKEWSISPEAYIPFQRLLTSGSAYLLNQFLEEHRNMFNHIALVRGDRLSFVPKSADTLRPITIGPSFSTYLQKGVGKELRIALDRAGNNISHAQRRHRCIVKHASESGDLSTIDLSSASDTISREVVKAICPDNVYQLLNSLRSHEYKYEDRWYTYEKFSGMGNCFTFELETLLFLSICRAVVPLEFHSKVSVYGDDMIVPTEYYHKVVSALCSFGFIVNNEKSFNDGYFRESCGADFFNGVAVRPYYCKDSLSHRQLVLFHNHLEEHGWFFLFPKLRKVFSRRLPNKLFRNKGKPSELRDGYLFGAFSIRENVPTIRLKKFRSRRDRKDPWALYLERMIRPDIYEAHILNGHGFYSINGREGSVYSYPDTLSKRTYIIN
jgi:hypothetical protein